MTAGAHAPVRSLNVAQVLRNLGSSPDTSRIRHCRLARVPDSSAMRDHLTCVKAFASGPLRLYNAVISIEAASCLHLTPSHTEERA
jgi:hypothetical protein